MFTEAGVPILQELQKQYNVTQDEMFSMISSGQVGIEQINAAMESMTGAGGQFFGMMEKQSQTMEGMFSTLADEAHIFARSVGEESFEILKAELSDLLATINEMRENGQLDAIAEDLGAGIAKFVTILINAVTILYNMRSVVAGVAGAYAAWKITLTTVNTVMGVANTLITAANILSGQTVVCKNLETGATIFADKVRVGNGSGYRRIDCKAGCA